MLLAIDPTRVALGDLPTCPTCGRPVHGITFPVGLVWMRCEFKRCPASPRSKFRAVALPPGTHGALLVELLGYDVAHELGRRLFAPIQRAESRGLAYQLETLELVPPGPTLYLTMQLVGPSYYRGPCAEEARAVVMHTTAHTMLRR